MEVKLRLRPRADPGRHVLVPDLGRLHDVAVAVEHGEILGGHRCPPSPLAWAGVPTTIRQRGGAINGAMLAPSPLVYRSPRL
jgi:hypothetical protein